MTTSAKKWYKSITIISAIGIIILGGYMIAIKNNNETGMALILLGVGGIGMRRATKNIIP